MTPAARLAAAIVVLDRVLAGAPVEQALTNWGRANRFAGSGDRYALRDLVFAALRCRRSFAAFGGGMTGRGLILGGLRASGADVDALFTGEGHAPPVAVEVGRQPVGNEALDVPEWLAGRLQAALGAEYPAVMAAMQLRAPVYVRVNLAKPGGAAALAAEGIVTRGVDWVNTALEVIENERKVQRSAAYLEGLVELQDASSQAVIAALGHLQGARVLDYCAGGGGKSLAMAAMGAQVVAHDAHVQRMKDLPDRAARAGVRIKISNNPAKAAPYDVVLMDVPCSGSGSWRRDPMGKWALTEARLAEILPLQAAIMDSCQALVAAQGVLAYATCSLLTEENEAQVAAFVARHPQWRVVSQRRFSPLQGGDGFYVAQLTRLPAKVTQP